jgi:hypothetical protein
VVDILGPEAAQRDRDQLGPLALGPPGPAPAVEQRLAEAEADVVQPELVLAGLVQQRDLLDDLARRGQRDPVLDPDPGRAPGAEVQPAEEGQRGPRVVVVLDRPAQWAHPVAGDRAAVKAGAGSAGHGQAVAVAFVGDNAAGGEVHEFVRVEPLTTVDP